MIKKLDRSIIGIINWKFHRFLSKGIVGKFLDFYEGN